jgi:hypothetical protein
MDDLLGRLEELLGEVDNLEEPIRQAVFELLDGIDAMHRLALGQLAKGIGSEAVQRLRDSDQAVAWLFGVDPALHSLARGQGRGAGGEAGGGPGADVGSLFRLLGLGDHPQGGH